MEQFHLDKPHEMPKPVDVTVCVLKQKHFLYPFLTIGINFSKSDRVNAGEKKFRIKKECFTSPNENDSYRVFGAVKTKIIDNIKIDREFTLKHNLKFISQNGDYYLFNTPDLILSKDDWEGLSGSPVLSDNGECVGVICDVRENSKSIWVMPMSKVQLLIEVAIQQEAQEEKKGYDQSEK